MSRDSPGTGGRSLTSSGTWHGGHTIWYGGSASLITRVRSNSWRATTSSSAPCRTARSTGPVMRIAETRINRGPNVPPSSPWSRVMNHSWVKDSGYRFDSWSSAMPLPWPSGKVTAPSRLRLKRHGEAASLGHRYRIGEPRQLTAGRRLDGHRPSADLHGPDHAGRDRDLGQRHLAA